MSTKKRLTVKNSLRICFVIDDTLDILDGVQRYVVTLGQWLTNHGHEVYYLAGESHNPKVSNVLSAAKNVRLDFNKNRLSIPLRAPKDVIEGYIKKHSFDVVHVQMPYSPLFAGKVVQIAEQKNIPVVGTFHIVPDGAIAKLGSYLLGAWQKKQVKQCFDSVVSVSTAAKEVADRMYGLDTGVVPNMFDRQSVMSSAVKKSPPKTSSPYMLYVGRLVERKGCLHLIKIYQQLLLRRDFIDHTLTIVGDGPLRQKLEAYVAKHGLQHKVDFLGYVSDHEKNLLYQNAALSIFPATGGESFGIVLLEAMAASSGAVIMAGNNNGYSSVLGACPEALFNPRDHTQAASKINTMLANEKLRKSVYKKQQNILPAYDVEKVAPQIIYVYLGVM